jgi:hypothetical protein
MIVTTICQHVTKLPIGYFFVVMINITNKVIICPYN